MSWILGTMTDLHRSEMRPLQGMQHRSEVEDLLAIEVKVVRSIVGITIPIEVLPQLDVRRLTGLMIPTAALQTIAIWMTIVICSLMILRVEVLLTAKKVLRFVKVNCLTVIVGLVVVVVVVVEVGKVLAMQTMHHAAQPLPEMICVNPAVVMFESQDAVMFENPGGFRIAAVRKATVAETTGLAVAMAEMTGIAGVVAVVTMEAAMTAEVDEMTGRRAVAEIWDADAIWVVRDVDARFSRPVR